jgi:hypothetical protein
MASASFLDQGKIVAIKAHDPEEKQHYDAQLSDLTKGAKPLFSINVGRHLPQTLWCARTIPGI